MNLTQTILSVLAAVSCLSRVAAADPAPAPAPFSPDVQALLDFESAQGWSDAGKLDTDPVKHGRYSMRWAYDQTKTIATKKIPADVSKFGTFSLWVHSAKANNATFMIIFDARTDPKVNSYYSHKVKVDWEGWKQIQVPFGHFRSARNPAGWDKLGSLRFTCTGWDMQPLKGTVLHLDQLEFLPGPGVVTEEKVEHLYVTAPPTDAWLKNLRKSHPRLILNDAEIARLKEGIQKDPLLKSWYAKVKESADKTLKAKPSIYEKRDGRRLLDVSRRVVDRVYDLGFVYLMGGGDAYLRRAYQELEAAGKFPDWNPSHYLDTGEMMHAFGIGYDWLYHGLTPAERTFLREALFKHGLRLSLNAYKGVKSEGMQSWKSAVNNWGFVCNGGTAIGAMAVLDEFPQPCTEILNSSFNYIQTPLAHFEPDGAWWEGVGYWSYSLRYLAPYLKCMETAFGTDFGFIEKMKPTGFARTGDFPIYLVNPLGNIYCFADSGSGTSQFGHHSLFYLADKFKNPLYQWYQLNRPNQSVESILYYRPMPQTPNIDSLPLDRYFRLTEVATMRSSWTNPDATFLAFKAGKNGIAHAHDDLGSFEFTALHERWLIDLGTEHETYMTHQHTHKRWEYYRIRAEGHNTLVINPGPGEDQYGKGEAKITRFESQPNAALLACDLTGAYEGVKKVTRGMRLLDGRNAMLMQDEIETEKPAQIWWFAHTPAKIALGPNKRTATLSRNGKSIQATLLSPANAEFIDMPAEPLPTSPNVAKQASNKAFRKLAIHCQAQKLTLTVAFTTQPGTETTIAKMPVEELAKWNLKK